MIYLTFRAMGTGVETWCRDQDAASELRARFEEVESVCSRFRPDSELSRINAAGAGGLIVSELLAEVMTAASRARDLTDGLVDVGVGSGVIDWGYDDSFELVTRLDRTPAPGTPPEWSLHGRSLWRSANTRIDLGGIAKGWTSDRVVEQGLATVASAGGDIRSVDPDTVVSVLDPWGEVAARIRLGAGALATSSITRRRWMVGAREVCHVIDPRTMEPVLTPVLSATVVARSAADAEAAAKAVLIRGEDGLAWASEQSWIDAALVVWHDGTVYATPGIEVAAA
jgi:thiamine biosynthesis lipoprotein